MPKKVEHQQTGRGKSEECSLPDKGKTVGIAARIDVPSARLSPARAMPILLSDHENWKSFTLADPMVVVSGPIAILLGCDRASLTAAKSCVPQSPASPFAEA